MAKQIIILDHPDTNRYKVAFWLPVPAQRQAFYANAAKNSVFTGISTQELADLRAGLFIEQTDDFNFDVVTNLAQTKAHLINEYNARLATAFVSNQWNRYGTSYDGVSWTAAGVT